MRTVRGPSSRVVVVGAGLAGLSAALHLAGRGREVTVVERESEADNIQIPCPLFVKPVAEIASYGQYGVIDHVARFETTTGDVGYGLHEHGFFGPFPKYGLERSDDGAS